MARNIGMVMLYKRFKIEDRFIYKRVQKSHICEDCDIYHRCARPVIHYLKSNTWQCSDRVSRYMTLNYVHYDTKEI
jgi:hypothetical protein